LRNCADGRESHPFSGRCTLADLSGFFSHYTASREHLPVKQCLADAGFDAALADYGGEAFISFQINPTASAPHHS
jgi:hypothetical protein